MTATIQLTGTRFAECSSKQRRKLGALRVVLPAENINYPQAPQAVLNNGLECG